VSTQTMTEGHLKIDWKKDKRFFELLYLLY